MGKDRTLSGISFVGALALIFITLKLTGYIDWPWLWVLAPIWVPWVVIAFALFVGVIALGAALLVWWLR